MSSAMEKQSETESSWVFTDSLAVSTAAINVEEQSFP